jgi:retron-type reverse transcriptase
MSMSFIKQIASAVEMSETDVLRIILTAPKRYKIYAVPKRDGVGMRVIAQPARELKVLQRYVANEVLQRLPIHEAARAYIRGKNIRDNAIPHLASRAIMKLDFRDFFHSLKFSDLKSVLMAQQFSGVTESEWALLENILFWQNPAKRSKCLAIGAPSSPLVSNIIMENLDQEIFVLCQKHGVAYTRYADDITLSAAKIELLVSCEKEIRKLVRKTRNPKLVFNDKKRGIFTKAGRRLITGLVVTPDRKISLGRERKREISAAIHHYVTGKNRTIEHVANTKGWLAYAHSVEPEFFGAMLRKYGDVVKRIMRVPTPRRPRVGL